MPKQVPAEELDAIATFVAGHPEGTRVGTIRDELKCQLPPRVLQRRLQRLIEEGRITAEGSGKGKRYLPVPEMSSAPGITGKSSQGYAALPLSAEAKEIQRIARSPLSARTPVGYSPAFLGSYAPNRSFYLAPGLRRELATVGQVGIGNLPAGTYLRKILDRLLIDLSWNSSRLEGNTYSLLETQRLFETGEIAEGKTAEDTQMILNHKAAIEMLADQADEIGFNRYTVCNLHAILSDNLLADPAACGRLRDRSVGIAGSTYRPLEVSQQIEEYLLEILDKAGSIDDPFEQAFFAMVQLPYLQPFEDVNKRVSRLAANIPLVRSNLCPLSFIDVPQDAYINGLIGVYELNRVDLLRDVFVWAYRRSAARYSAVLQSLGDPDPFRLRYRNEIGTFVREIVRGGLHKQEAARAIADRTETEIAGIDRARFIEVVETELSCLHAGNIARYRLRPDEFDKWQQSWK